MHELAYISYPYLINARYMMFLNQACTGLWPVHAWFLKIDPVRFVSIRACVCVCLCVSTPEAINN